MHVITVLILSLKLILMILNSKYLHHNILKEEFKLLN